MRASRTFWLAIAAAAWLRVPCAVAGAEPTSASLSAGPARRAEAVSGELSISGMQPEFVIVGQPTTVSVQGTAFSPGTEVEVSTSGFQALVGNVQLTGSELLVGTVSLPETAIGSVSVTVRRPDGSTANLPNAAQAHEVYWGILTPDGTTYSGKIGSGAPLWIEDATGLSSAPAQVSQAGKASSGITDCQRISFCTIPSPGLGDFRPSIVSPNKCESIAQEYPATNGLTYFFCTTGPCTPSSPNLITDKEVALKVFPRYWTGGHCHSQADRPNGSPDSASGNLGSTGLSFGVDHTWPDVAGAVNVVVYSNDSSWQFNAQRDTNYVYCIREPNLHEMQAGVGYVLIGDKPWHPFNHFANMNVIDALKLLVQDVAARLPSALPLRLNDMSLVSGGLFDIQRNWGKPHCSHRNGAAVDLGIKQMAADPSGRELLEALCRMRGFNVAEEDSAESNWHWHLTYKYPPKEKK